MHKPYVHYFLWFRVFFLSSMMVKYLCGSKTPCFCSVQRPIFWSSSSWWPSTWSISSTGSLHTMKSMRESRLTLNIILMNGSTCTVTSNSTLPTIKYILTTQSMQIDQNQWSPSILLPSRYNARYKTEKVRLRRKNKKLRARNVSKSWRKRPRKRARREKESRRISIKLLQSTLSKKLFQRLKTKRILVWFTRRHWDT